MIRGRRTYACPDGIIDQLGLEILREVEVTTAAGTRTTRVFSDLRVHIEDRVGTFDCVELPGGETVLVGVILLEALGFEPELSEERLRKLPMEPSDTYLTNY